MDAIERFEADILSNIFLKKLLLLSASSASVPEFPSILPEMDNFEIHTEFESINIQSKIYFATPFDDVSDSIDYTYKLKPAYHLLYVIIHIAHHLKTGGVGIRMIMDIDVLIHTQARNRIKIS